MIIPCILHLKGKGPLLDPVIGMPEDVVVPRRTTKEVRKVEGNLIIDDATVKSEQPGEVIQVSGITDCREDCYIEAGLTTSELRGRGGDVVVDGDLNAENSIKIKRGRLEVRGNLTTKKMEVDRRVEVSEDMSIDSARVGGSLNVRGNSKATRVDVGGSFRADSDAEVDEIDVGGSVSVGGATKSDSIDVGGTFRGEGPVEAKKIDVGGSVKIESEASVEDIDVGGSVKLSGGTARGRIRVGGTLKSSKPLEFGHIRVGGSVTIAGGKGEDIDVGGTFRSEGDLTFETIDVGGTVRIEGNAYGKSVEVGGTVRVMDDLELSEELKVGGTADIGGKLTARSVRVGGKVEAEKIEAVEEIKTNTLRTRSGAMARRIELGRRGEAEGPLIARTVIVRDRCRVEDIHAEAVTLRRDSRARNIYAARIDIESGCRISGEVKYTESLNVERDVSLVSEPEKVEKLPEPPLM